MINIQKYIRAQSLDEAYRLNQNRQNRIIGGMLWLKMGKGNVNTAIDLCGLGLDVVEETEEQFSVGAMVTLRQIELHEGLNVYTWGAAAAAVKDIVGVQFRNLATIGGSIWGRFGFSDVLTFFLSMETYVELHKGGIIPLEQFASMKYDNDILVRLIVKKIPGEFIYSSMRNQRTDFPVIACALSRIGGKRPAAIGESRLQTEGECPTAIGESLSQIEEEYRAVIGARPDRAMAVRDERGLLSGGLTEEGIKAFADYVAEVTPTGSNTRGSAAYRTHLIRVLTERKLSELGGI